MKALLPLFLVTAATWAAAGAARAEAPSVPPASCFAHPERWSYDRAHETLAAPGERFLADLSACDPTFSAAVIEAVRYQIQSDEAQKFARARGYVMAAYGIAWALLAVSAVALWLRQRRLGAELATLEGRLREAERESRP